MYLIGEALIGEGNEVAHVDLLIGDKEGPVGTAFANWFDTVIHGAHAPARGRSAQPYTEAGDHHRAESHG